MSFSTAWCRTKYCTAIIIALQMCAIFQLQRTALIKYFAGNYISSAMHLFPTSLNYSLYLHLDGRSLHFHALTMTDIKQFIGSSQDKMMTKEKSESIVKFELLYYNKESIKYTEAEAPGYKIIFLETFKGYEYFCKAWLITYNKLTWNYIIFRFFLFICENGTMTNLVLVS